MIEPQENDHSISPGAQQALAALAGFSPNVVPVFHRMLSHFPELISCAPGLADAFQVIASGFKRGGTLFVCGNGGSQADALHICGELDKSFKLARPLSDLEKERFKGLPGGDDLSAYLQRGLAAIPLGANPALTSAIANDNPLPHIVFAQELYALGRRGDIFLGISTSGHAHNVRYAASTAHALGIKVISLTGPAGGPLAEQADIAVRAPGSSTAEIQGWHIQLYHCLCEMLEIDAFGEN